MFFSNTRSIIFYYNFYMLLVYCGHNAYIWGIFNWPGIPQGVTGILMYPNDLGDIQVDEMVQWFGKQFFPVGADVPDLKIPDINT